MFEFKKEQTSELNKLLPYLNKYDFKFGAYTIGWKVIWSDFSNISYTIINNHYVQYLDSDNQKYFFYPLSLDNDNNEEKQTLKIIANYCYQNKIKLNFTCVPKHKVTNIISLFYTNCKISQDRKWMNYSYDANNFVNLNGSDYAKQRNNIRKFAKLNLEYEFQPINKNNIDEAKQFISNWWKNYDLKKIDEFAKYAMIHEPLILDYFFKYEFVGAILKIDKKIVALCVGEKCGNTLFNHVEKIDHKIKGLDCFFSNLFAKYFVTDKIKYINREDDAGNKGLRKSKLQYHPEELVPGYTINVNTELYQINKPTTIKVDNELVLKDITKNDVTYFDLCVNDKLNKYYGYDYHKDFDEKTNSNQVTLDWFLKSRQNDIDNHLEVSWGIFANNKLVGEVSLFDINYNHEGWIGFRTLETEQRKGYTFKSVEKLISYALYELGLDKLYSKCFKQNIASSNLLKKVGMKLIKEDDKFYYFEISNK